MALLFLLPATALVVVLLVVSLPAWHAHPLNPPQLFFDIGFAIVVVGVAAGWKVRFSSRAVHPAWRTLLVLGAATGAAGAVLAALHFFLGVELAVWVGYALLSPGVLLVPPALASSRRAKRSSSGA